MAEAGIGRQLSCAGEPQDEIKRPDRVLDAVYRQPSVQSCAAHDRQFCVELAGSSTRKERDEEGDLRAESELES